jgi:hypothetical protein
VAVLRNRNGDRGQFTLRHLLMDEATNIAEAVILRCGTRRTKVIRFLPENRVGMQNKQEAKE